MAKKKVPSAEDALKSFKEVMQRASLSSYYYVDNTIVSKNDSNNNILVIQDPLLWEKLIDDEEWKKENDLKEIDPTDQDGSGLSSWVEYVRDLKSNWLDIDVESDLHTGKIFKIKINSYEYKITINRDLMPMKLKKSEYEGISYKVFSKPLHILGIKKRFEGVVEGYGFTIIRLFQII